MGIMPGITKKLDARGDALGAGEAGPSDGCRTRPKATVLDIVRRQCDTRRGVLAVRPLLDRGCGVVRVRCRGAGASFLLPCQTIPPKEPLIGLPVLFTRTVKLV